jgi:hypothetical protein
MVNSPCTEAAAARPNPVALCGVPLPPHTRPQAYLIRASAAPASGGDDSGGPAQVRFPPPLDWARMACPQGLARNRES